MAWRSARCLALLFALGPLAAGAQLDAPEDGEDGHHDRAPRTATVWFTPRSSIPVWNVFRPDFIQLFEPDAPWPRAASHVRVFKLYSQFASTSIPNGGSTDAELKQAIDALNARHIAIGMEAGLLSVAGLCGKIEGYCGENIGTLAARIKRLGGDLRYVAMDEPLWFGHVSNEPGAQQASIAALAVNVAAQAATLRQYFPDVEIGDIEPIQGTAGPADYLQEIEDWADAFAAATGRPLAFIHSDVGWQGSGWRPQLAGLSRLTRARGIAFGIIYNGNPDDSPGSVWTTDAEKHFVDIERDPAMVPDNAIIQTWDAQPDHALPETLPGTMTYLVDRYAAAETAIAARRTPDGFEGTLTARGAPAADAQLLAFEIDDGTLNITHTASLGNTVPLTAVSALVGLRVNVECSCDGCASVLLGGATYVDGASQASETIDIVPPGQRVVVPASQTRLVNSPSFAVTPGDPFTFSVPMQLPFSSRDTGYVAIIFLGSNGIEVSRFTLPFQPGERRIGAPVTNEKGRFEITLPAGVKPPAIARFDFTGNARFRLSSRLSCGAGGHDTDESENTAGCAAR